MSTKTNMPMVELRELTEEEERQLPTYEAIPRLSWSSSQTKEQKKGEEKQQEYDRMVLFSLAVGGFNDRSCPKNGEDVAMLFTGAVLYATKGELLRLVPETRLMDHNGSFIHEGLWFLVWNSLGKYVECPSKLRESLYRWLVPHIHRGDTYNHGHTDCDITSFWDERKIVPEASVSAGCLALEIYRGGDRLEKFSTEEQLFLRKLFEGLKLMNDQFMKDYRPNAYQY